MQLWLSEKIYKCPDITVYGLAAYCSIKTLLPNEEIKQIYVNGDILSYQLMKTMNVQRRFVESIKTGLTELIDQNFVKVIETKGQNSIIDCSNLFITEQKEYFTIISYDELLKIFQLEKNNFSILKYFVLLIGTVSSSIDVWIDAYQHKTRVVGNLTIDYLSQLFGISERTIIRYNKILEDIGILYVYRSNDFLIDKDTGEISRLTNIYGRPEDKIYIDTYAVNQKKYKESYRYVENNTKKANAKRRLAQMYNQICKGKDSNYSKKDIKQVYQYVAQENHKYEVLYKKNNDKSCSEKIRDLQVFEKYDFITKEEN